MQTYPIKRGHAKNVEGVRLKDVMEMIFGPVREEGGHFVANYGALERISARADGKTLQVDTVMNPKVDEDAAIRTRQAWNTFLERATGFSAKERARRAKKATEGDTPKA